MNSLSQLSKHAKSRNCQRYQAAAKVIDRIKLLGYFIYSSAAIYFFINISK